MSQVKQGGCRRYYFIRVLHGTIVYIHYTWQRNRKASNEVHGKLRKYTENLGNKKKDMSQDNDDISRSRKINSHNNSCTQIDNTHYESVRSLVTYSLKDLIYKRHSNTFINGYVGNRSSRKRNQEIKTKLYCINDIRVQVISSRKCLMRRLTRQLGFLPLQETEKIG